MTTPQNEPQTPAQRALAEMRSEADNVLDVLLLAEIAEALNDMRDEPGREHIDAPHPPRPVVQVWYRSSNTETWW